MYSLIVNYYNLKFILFQFVEDFGKMLIVQFLIILKFDEIEEKIKME